LSLPTLLYAALSELVCSFWSHHHLTQLFNASMLRGTVPMPCCRQLLP
jgi:hypothetical protein